MGEVLGSQHLHPHREAADGDVLPFPHVLQGAPYNLLGGVEAVVVNDGFIVHHGSVKEIGGDPAGADRHDLDAPLLLLQLLVEGAGEAQDEGLGGAVDVDVGDGLEGGQASQLVQ